ncbi:MAG: hypothetical protein BZ138_06015 [Methanosphaera sp. rholeuAM270]|nr:MAG: hypothetical protein BZ138_06015 [Methanosphaera sp. rholeuAM270]
MITQPTKEATSTEQEYWEVEQTLLHTEWKNEAKQIPLDSVTPSEKKVLEKCIQEEPLTKEEHILLRETLHRYRQALREYNPEETLQNYENNVQLVDDEKTFLKLVEEFQESQGIIMYYPLGDRELKLDLLVTPITDSRAVLEIQNNLTLFQDLTEEELLVYNKQEQGKQLSREEQIISTRVQEKIQEQTQERQMDIMIEFLAMQTRFRNSESTYESMKTVYQHMSIGYLALLFQRVQNMSGLGDIETERVFRESD